MSQIEVVEGVIVDDEPQRFGLAKPPSMKPLTPVKCRNIVATVKDKKVPMATAAKLEGIRPRVVYEAIRWVDDHFENLPAKHPMKRFVIELDQAHAEVMTEITSKLHQHALTHRDWKAAMTFAERFDPDNWRRPPEGPSSVTVNVGIVDAMRKIRDDQGANALGTGD